MKQTIKIMLLLFVTSIAVSAEQASTESIKKLMLKTGAGDLGVQVVNQLTPALKQMIPNAPDSFWADMTKEINADVLIEKIIPIYQKHFTEADIKSIIKFYDTTAGKNLIASLPIIQRETMMVGQQWGQEIAKKAMAKYQASQAK